MADNKVKKPETVELIKTKKEEQIVKAYEALIGRRAYETVQDIRQELFQQIQTGTCPDKMAQYQQAQASTYIMASSILDETEQKELAKKNPKLSIIKWVQEARIELMKASGEVRKAIESEHDMRFGKKQINVNIKSKKSLDEWMNTPEKTDGEVIDVENTAVIDKDKE